MKIWISCNLDNDGNLIKVGRVAYRDGHAIKCTVTLMAKSGEVTRDDDDLKVINNGSGYAAFVPIVIAESYGLDELVKTDGQMEKQSQVELGADIVQEAGDDGDQAVEMAGAAAGGESG